MATIRDVAEESGVSIATVSQVLNNGGRPVSEATRQRVLKTANRLNYHPNAMARSLILSRTDTIGLVYLHSHTPVHTAASFVLMLDGVLTAGTQLRQNILMCTSYSWADGDANQSVLLDRRCDGYILVVPTLDNRAIPALQRREVPFVLLCSSSEDPTVSSVDSDNAVGIGLLMEYLFSLGHRRIAFLHSAYEDNFSYARERMTAYGTYLAQNGIAPYPDYDWQYDGPEALLTWIRQQGTYRPTALVCSSDSLALEVIQALQQAGMRVPQDVSVAGFDGIEQGVTSLPSLTTVSQPLREIGAQCVQNVLDQVQGRGRSRVRNRFCPVNW